MKLHLPASLLSALLAAAPAVHAATSDIPSGHTQITLTPSGTSYKLSLDYYGKNYAFVLGKDLTITAPVGKEIYGYYAGGDYIFTSPTEDTKYELKLDFLSGTSGNRLVKQSNLRFEDLKTLTLSYYNPKNTGFKQETNVMGSLYYDQEGKSLIVNNVDAVTFRSIYVHTAGDVALRGGLISTYNKNSKVEFTNNGSISFADLTVENSGNKTTNVVGWVAGGVIHSGGDVSFADNTAVSFTNISTSVSRNCEDTAEFNAYGGAIAAYQGDVNFSGNDSVTFSKVAVSSADARAYGGAISLLSGSGTAIGSTLSISENGNVTFEENYANGRERTNLSSMSYGGAIAAGTNDIINIVNNKGTVKFEGNHAELMGGAIYAALTGGTAAGRSPAKINIAGNNEVYFTKNYVACGKDAYLYKADISGGAIYAESLVTIANNEYVEFSGNYLQNKTGTKQGAAIYMAGSDASASLVIEGNQRVIFKKNYTLASHSSTGAYYSFGSIYGANTQAKNVFSAKTGGNIQFHDAVYLMGDLAINSDYLDKSGVTQSAGGVVLFTGAYVNEYKEDSVFKHHNFTGDPYTSTLGGDVTVHGGTLQVHGSANVNIGGGLSVAGSVDNVANVKVGNGTLNVGSLTSAAGSADINLNAYGAMSLTGTAKVTAGQVTLTGGKLTMADTANLKATAGDLTASNAAGITMTGGAMSIGSKKLTLDTGAEMNLSGSAAVTAGQVTLTDATLTMQGGKLTATGGNLEVRKSSPEVALADEGAAEKTYDVAISGGTLDIGGQALDLGSGTSMELSGGQVTAGQVTLKNAALDMAGNAVLTASDQVTLDGSTLTMEGGTLNASAKGLSVQAAGIKMTGGTLNNGEHALALGSGTSMELSGNAAVTAGQVTLADATLKMQGGTLKATDGNLVVRKSSPEVALADEGAAEKTYDVAISGGTLDIGGQALDLGSGTSMELSGGQVTAGQVTLKNAALDMAGNAVLTASDQVTLDGSTLTMEGGTLNASAKGLSVQAAGIKMTGGTLNNGEHALALGSGTSMELSGNAAVTAGQVTLADATLKMQGGTLKATDGNLVVRKSSPEVALADEGAAEKTYDVAISGGTLDIGGQTLDLGSGTSMELSGGQVAAGQVKLENAALDMAGDAKLTASGQVMLEGAKLTIAGEAQVDAQGGVTVKRTADCQAELVMKGGKLNAGTLVLQDATLQMEGGVVDASTGGVNLYDSASLVMKGGELKAGESDITLGAGMKLSLSESAVVSAGSITLGADASLLVSVPTTGGADTPAVQTLSSVDNMDPTVQGAMAGATLSSDLVLMGGSTYTAEGGSLSLDGHDLTLSMSDASKINLVLTLDQLANPDAQVIIFSEVKMVNFLFNVDGEAAFASADGIVSVSASNYFNNEWTNEYYVNFDESAGLVYLSSGLPTGPSDPVTPPDTPPVPEPTTSTLSLVALAGLALRRRRRH